MWRRSLVLRSQFSFGLRRTNNICSGNLILKRQWMRPMLFELSLGTQYQFRVQSTKSNAIEINPVENVQKSRLSVSEANGSGFRDVRRLFRLAKPETLQIILALVLILISSSVSMTIPTIVGKLLDIAKDKHDQEAIDDEKESPKIFGMTTKQFCIAIMGVFVVGAAANAGRVVILKITGERLVARLRTRTMKAALDQDATFLDANRVGDLISRLSSDASIVAKSVTQNVSDGTRAIIQGCVGFGMMSYISWQLTSVMVLMIPPLGIMAVIYGKKIRNLSRQLQTAVGGLTKVAEEQLGATKTIQSYVGEKNEIHRYASEVRSVFNIGLKEALVSGAFFGSTGLVGNTALLALLVVGSNMIQSGSMTVGDLSSFMMYAVYTGSSMFGLSSFYSELMKGAGAAARVFELKDRKPLIPPTIGADPITLRNKPITFDHVSFTYPTRPNHMIFQDLNLTVQPGEHVCFVGPSGSGKSTVASLLLRYYDPDRGAVLIGDQNIKSFNLRKYRRLLAVVQQEPLLFNGTILDNILYSVPPQLAQDQHLVSQAIGQANCTKFLANFPDGLQTLVGPRGTQLSGGQKQRIALARAFLLNPSLLILDEATSALDSQSEEVVAQALHKRVQTGKTTISIAHRLSTIKHCTRVIVLGKHGSVIESGSFQELTRNPQSELNILLSQQQEDIPSHNKKTLKYTK
ncbi:hypothetical protein HG537_0B00860 [Torulaspora globosa]|uniref:Uncharacterized protein n=1 Tax=Torulaspora globosa TaxID=48254 RepID=A0A7H9HQ21_9SACH|nr:hypothetical protein HG537_0B00860 [Torulaspora sp. CBS 2947]